MKLRLFKNITLVCLTYFSAYSNVNAVINDSPSGEQGGWKSEYCQNRIARTYSPPINNTRMIFLNGDYLLWQSQIVVKGTEFCVAPTYTYKFILQKVEDGNWFWLKYSFNDSHNKLPLWIFPDGTTVFWQDYPKAFIFVSSEGLKKEQIVINEKLRDRKDAPYTLVANQFKIIVQSHNLNDSEPLFFAPWSSHHDSVDFTLACMLARGTKYHVNSSWRDIGQVIFDIDDNVVVLWKHPVICLNKIGTSGAKLIDIEHLLKVPYTKKHDWQFAGACSRYCLVQYYRKTVVFDMEKQQHRTIDITDYVACVRNGRCYFWKWDGNRQDYVLEEILLESGRKTTLLESGIKKTKWGGPGNQVSSTSSGLFIRQGEQFYLLRDPQ